MYQYQDDILNTDFILKNYNQEQIFYIVFGEQMFKNKYICSPFRKDNNPDCYFHWYNNILYFIDFGDRKKSRTCFQVIMERYDISLQQSCVFIHDYFSNKDTKMEISKIADKRIEKKEKVLFSINVKTRNFNIYDKEFWQPLEITKKQLIDDKVYPIYWYKTLNFYPKDFMVRSFGDKDILYAYTDFKDKRKKIYRPLTKRKRSKWFTNCLNDDIGNFDDLPVTDNNLIITKSYKDCRIIRNQNINSIWFQSEYSIPDLNLLYDLTLRFNNIYILYDNDTTGIENTGKIVDIFTTNFKKEVKPIFIPIDMGKDSAAFFKKNKEQYKQFLITNLKI